MRTKIVAGNWKMNKTRIDAESLINEVVQKLKSASLPENRKVVMAPPFPFIELAVNLCRNVKNVFAGAQNCHTEQKGAYTGEVSAEMISSIGAKYVIIGHSERRAYFHEDDDFLSKKVTAAIQNNLVPIFCCGETLPERKNENQFKVVKTQLDNGLFILDQEQIVKTVIAYEPVWAIGTGVTATPEQAQKMHAYIRQLLMKRYNEHIADHYTILYGGSCNAANARELFANPDVDGGLIGGAALKAEDFLAIVNSF